MFTVTIRDGRWQRSYGFSRSADAERFAGKCQMLGLHPSLGYESSIDMQKQLICRGAA